MRTYLRYCVVLSVAASLSLVGALGCSGDDPINTGAGGAAATSGPGGTSVGGSGGSGAAATTSSGMGGQLPMCEAPEPDHAGIETAMGVVTANYIDQAGSPAEDVNTTICGTNLCSTPVDSDASGAVSVDAGGSTYSDSSFNVSHSAKGYIKLSGRIPSSPTYDFGTVRVFRFAPFSEGVDILPGASASHGGVTLTVPAGSVVEYDLLSFTEDQRPLLGMVADITGYDASELPAVYPSLGLEVLVAVSPLGTHICPAAALSFDNVMGWDPGAAVEILINGAKIFDHYAPYGEWSLISDAVVSADGKTVETVADQGVETLGTFGARLKQ